MRWAHLKKLILWPLKSYFFKAFWPLLVLFEVRNSRFFCPVLDENFQVSRAVIPFKQIFFFFLAWYKFFGGKKGMGSVLCFPKGFKIPLKNQIVHEKCFEGAALEQPGEGFCEIFHSLPPIPVGNSWRFINFNFNFSLCLLFGVLTEVLDVFF